MPHKIAFEGVFFDLGNTLAPFTPRDSMEFVVKWFFASGIEGSGPSFFDFLQSYRAVILREREIMAARPWETDVGTRSRMIAEDLVSRGFPDRDIASRLERSHTGAFTSSLRMGRGGREVLEALSSSVSPSGKRPRIGLISNAADGAAIRTFLDRERIRHHFDSVVISDEEGFGKPHPEIFLLPLRRLGLDPASSVYIGDRYVVDVVGARNVGMKAVYIREHHTTGEPPEGLEISPPVIEDILDLPPLLSQGF